MKPVSSKARRCAGQLVGGLDIAADDAGMQTKIKARPAIGHIDRRRRLSRLRRQVGCQGTG